MESVGLCHFGGRVGWKERIYWHNFFFLKNLEKGGHTIKVRIWYLI